MKYINTVIVMGIFLVLIGLLLTMTFGNLSPEIHSKFTDIILSTLTGLVGFLARDIVSKPSSSTSSEQVKPNE
jgi:glycopeptide antibiotics resistance protein